HSSSTRTTTQNLAFVSSSNTNSTTESVSAAASVFAVCAKMPVSSLLNVDSLSNAVIYSFFASQSSSPQLDNEDLKQIDTGRNLGANGPTYMGFDMSKVECYNYHRKGHFAWECRSPKDSRRNGSYDWSFQAEDEPANYALIAFSSLSSSSDNEPPSSLYDRFQPSDGYHAVPLPYIGTLMPPKPDLVFNTAPTAIETDHSAFNVQLSPTKPEQDLSLINRPTTPITEDCISDSEDESETKAPQIVPSFVQSTKQVKSPRHSVQHVETFILAATPKPESPKPAINGNRMNRKACFVFKSLDHLIKECDYYEKKMVQPTIRNHAHRVSNAVPKIRVTRPKQVQPIVTKPKSPTRRHITRSPSPKTSNSPPRVTAVKAPVGNPQHALKDKGVIDSGCSRHMTGNMSYLSDFKELNGGYELKFNLFSVSQMCDKKNNVLFTDTECLVLSPDFKLADESQVMLRVPRENNMYNVNLKNIVPSEDLACLFAKATIDESNLWHRRLGHINFKIMNKLNRELVTKPHNKTPYELLHGRTPSIGFMRPFGCLVTILNTLDSLGKFDGKVDEGFLVRYSVISKTFRVFNSRTCVLQETLHVNFLENKSNVAGRGPTWLFDIDSLTRTMNYQLITVGNQTNLTAGLQEKFNAEKVGEESDQQYVLFPVWSSGSTDPQNKDGDTSFDRKEPNFNAKKPEFEVNVSPSSSAQSRKQDDKSKKEAKSKIPTVRQISPNSTNTFSVVGPSNAAASPTHGKSSFIDASQLLDNPDMPELEDTTYSDDEDDVGAEADFNNLETSITVSPILTSRVHKDHPVTQIIGDLSSTTEEELLQFKMLKVWILVDLSYGKRAIVARIEAIGLFLAYASFMGFMVYQMDVKSAFLYGTIGEEVYVCQPLGFEDPHYPDKVYKVVKALYGLHQVPRACQDKYVAEILRKFGLTKGKSASTPIDTKKPLLKDPDGEDVDVHTYRSMIGSLMYLTSSRPDIMFAVNNVTRLQALVDKRKVVVMEATIREALRLDDEEGVECLPNEEIFCMSATRTSWNEFSSSMASVVICLSSGRKFNFSKYIFDRLVDEEGDADENVKEVNAGDAAEEDVSAAHGDVPTGKGILVEEPKPLKKKQQIEHDEQYARELHAELNKDINWDKVLEDDKEVADEAKEGDETEPAEFQEVIDVVTTAKLITEVVTASSETVTAASAIITAAEAQVPAATTVVTLTAASARVVAAPSRRRKGVVIMDLQEESTTSTIIPAETKSKDKGKGILTEAQAKKNTMLYLKNVDGFKMYYFKGMYYDDIRPIFEAKERAAKRRKLNKEVEELKRHLQIVSNEDDDVYTEATPLARKVPVVDYQIIELNNKPYYKIIRADDTHQLYVSFLSLLRNFDREDLEALLSLVKERFSTTNPKNFSDDILLVILGAMFEKPDIQRKFPLTRFTLDQMLNVVRLEVEEESEVSLELLRFTRQQHQEGQLE
nr:hypothetical protein [Tanacetum cinerariifolium]